MVVEPLVRQEFEAASAGIPVGLPVTGADGGDDLVIPASDERHDTAIFGKQLKSEEALEEVDACWVDDGPESLAGLGQVD